MKGPRVSRFQGKGMFGKSEAGGLPSEPFQTL